MTSLGGAETSGAVVMYQEVTEQQLATEKILKQAVLLEQAEDAILVQDMQGRIEYWNNSATKLHGWEAIEVLGRCADDFLYEDSGSMKEIWAILLGSGAWHGELKKLTKDGRVLTFQSRWTLVRDAADNLKSVLSIDTDVTMEKKFEEQVLRVQLLESIGTLAGGIAHDLKPTCVSRSMMYR